MDGVMTSLPYFGPTDAPTLPGVPTPGSPSAASTGPNFSDIRNLLSGPSINRPIGGGTNFERGISELAPSTGLRPEIQSALDLIRQRGDEQKQRNISDAIGLAARRGITGSSTELFGTTQGALAADKATQEQSANLLLANAQREQALQDARANAMFNRANQEGSLGAQLGMNEANLTSDELASLRNMDFANRQLFLEGYLGQQGLDISRANIGASQDIASQQAKYGLISSLGQMLVPSLLGGGGGGGGALGGLLGGGGGGGGGLFSGLFGGGGGSSLTGAGTGQFVPGIGQVGTGVPAAGGIGMGTLLGGAGLGLLGAGLGRGAFGGGNDAGSLVGGGLGFALGGPLGAGLGSFLGTAAQRGGEKIYDATQKAFGNTGASFIKPFVDPVGSIKSVGKSISKVFPF